MTEIRLEEQLGEVLHARNLWICTAESCTGGLIASRLTDIPGSSAYVMGGVIAYSNALKQQLLGVSKDILDSAGAVSEQTAYAMAVNARKLLKADLALSVTGIAGPGGGSPSKPVGLTYIGLAGLNDMVMVARFVWTGDREANKQASADAAFRLALAHLTG